MPNKYNLLYTLDSNNNIIYKSDEAFNLECLNPLLFNEILDKVNNLSSSLESFSKIINVGANDSPRIFSIVSKDSGYDVYCAYDFKYGFNKISRAMSIINMGFIDYDKSSNKILRIYYHGKNLFLDRTKDELLNDNILNIYEDDFEGFKNAFEAFILREFNDVIYFRTDVFTGELRWYSFEDIEPSSDNPNILHGCINDVDKYTDDNKKGFEKVFVDQLTGLYNKDGICRYIFDILKKIPNEVYFLGKINIDNFSEFNKSYGRVFGDSILKKVAVILKSLLSSNAKIARIGADEFLFIDKFDTDDQMVIRPILRDLKLSLQGVKILDVDNVTISTTTGIASYPKDGLNFDVLDIALSKALYRGKMKGGSCYIIYQYEKHGDIDINEKKYKNIHNGIKFNNNQYISDVINKFINSDNINKTINHILLDLCEHFTVDRIIIADDKGNINYQAVINDYHRLNKFYPIAYDNEYLRQFNKDNIRFNNYIDVTDIGFGLSELRACGVKAYIQVMLMDENGFSGYISFEDLTSRRVWSSSDIAFVNTITKIISAFYIKYKTEIMLNETLYIDPVTGYNNLNKFKELVSSMEFNDNEKVFINLDIKKFTHINDKHGFSKGDEILHIIADIINSFINNNEYFCRIGDDKFGVILDYYNEEEFLNRLDNIIKSIDKQILILTNENISLSAGYYIVLKDDSVSSMIDKANYARKKAKNDNVLYLKYDDKLLEEDKYNKYLEDRMNNALIENEFIVYLQPCYYIKTNRVCSMEALVRWNMDGRLVSPIEFIPLFEKNGFITKLDFYVYDKVCSTIRRYKDLGYEVPVISINVSRRHIENENFLDELNNVLDKYNISKSNIGVELTESLFIDKEYEMIEFVSKLHNEGYRIYMDDFGVAYSTLSLLGRLHVDVIKLDKSFIDDTKDNPNEMIIISNIIRMAKELGIKVLSEGIETEIQLKQLSKMNCDYAQGYWFARPTNIEEIVGYLKKVE